jgi:predicted component of type VI protein secretion system
VPKLILEYGGERRELKVGGPVTIGRAPTATLQINHNTLSREHTQFFLQGGQLFVRDMESKNGTYVNGQLVKQAQALRHGDRVQVGPAVVATVVLESAPAPAAPPPVPAAPARPAPAPAAARPRTRRMEAVGSGGEIAALAARYLATFVAVGVFVVGTWFAKGIFSWLLDKIAT